MLHGQVRYNIASRFLDELPRDLVQWLSPRRPKAVAPRSTSTSPSGARGAAAPASARAAPATPRRSASQPPGRPGASGSSVRHAKFGLGVIIDAEGRGDDARVQVNFRDAGVKWLALEYAKLEAA